MGVISCFFFRVVAESTTLKQVHSPTEFCSTLFCVNDVDLHQRLPTIDQSDDPLDSRYRIINYVGTINNTTSILYKKSPFSKSICWYAIPL